MYQTKITNTTATNVTKIVVKNVRHCYILHTVLLAIILLLIITIICHHYAKQRSIENNEFKSVCIKNHTCYYFDDTIKLGGFDTDYVLIDKRSNKNLLIYDISYKTLI